MSDKRWRPYPYPYKSDKFIIPKEQAMPVENLSPGENDFVQAHEDSKRRQGYSQQETPDYYEGVDMLSTPDRDFPIPDAFYNQVQQPSVDPTNRDPDRWKDVVTNDDLMLVLLLTLEGYETVNISHRLKADAPPDLNKDLSKRQTIHDMQHNIGNLFRGRVIPKALQTTMAEGLIQSFVKWCTGEGSNLAQLARAKEFEQAGGDRQRLGTYARLRKNKKLNISEQYGYTTAWVEQRVNDGIWKSLLFEWWEHGTINNKVIPEKRA